MSVIRTILVAENDDHDFLFISRALKAAGCLGCIVRAEDGDAAIHELEHIGEPRLQLPALALVDLKMPGCDGFDVLRWKRRHAELPCVPIIIFSSSNIESDVKEAYLLGAHSFTVKPLQFADYVRYCVSLQEWWSRCEFSEG